MGKDGIGFSSDWETACVLYADVMDIKPFSLVKLDEGDVYGHN